MFENISSRQLEKAGQLKARIEALEQELKQIVGDVVFQTSSSVGSQDSAKPAHKRKMSAEGKARIVAAQKARWAKFNAKSSASTVGAPKPNKTMSPAAKAKIAAAAKKRWKKAKAAGKNSL
jgi:hypothetical protein